MLFLKHNPPKDKEIVLSHEPHEARQRGKIDKIPCKILLY
jgi:hypothetical protein